MNSGIRARQRDIVLIPFPYSDLSQEKRRPAIIISGNNYNQRNQDVICCAITSNPREYHQSIAITPSDLESGMLTYESRIKPTKIFTIKQDLILKTLATLNTFTSKAVVNTIGTTIVIEE